MSDDVRDPIHAFVLARFLPGEAASTLADDTPLITTGIVNSLLLLEIATFLEAQFGIELTPEDLDAERFASVASMAALVRARRGP